MIAILALVGTCFGIGLSAGATLRMSRRVIKSLLAGLD